MSIMIFFFKIRIWFLLLLLMLIGVVSSLFFVTKYSIWTYDMLNDNKPVKTLTVAKKILEQYPTVSFLELPAHIKQPFYETKYNLQKGILNSRFYLIPRKDLLKKLFFNNRINNFVSKEQQIQGLWYFQKGEAYVCIDEKLFESLFLLQEKLTKVNCDPGALIINSGYRSPHHNKVAGGAPLSQHLFGKAIDLKIGDINRDRSVNQEDKKIVYKILQLDVIANKGGLGFYPNTQILHMDVRGVPARWDYYKRKK
jgi:uncharacterized protein YcbK (DUF882 family)